MTTKEQNTGSGTQTVPPPDVSKHDQSGTHDEGKKAGPVDPRRPPKFDGDRNSRDVGARYTGPTMIERELMNTPGK
jgi:hypothetical protein